MLSDNNKVNEKTIHVNTLCEAIHDNRFTVLNAILFNTVLSRQETKLREDLGPRRVARLYDIKKTVCHDL